MARFPLTQAQWRTLADPKYKLELELNPDPAQFKGPDLPVETVNWRDAREWCARLNSYLIQQLGEACVTVALPSEAQWEYACRAGSGTPFNFGDTLDLTWANYNGNYIYDPRKFGVYLNLPTPVGAYGLVNQWGLADMHGNVSEWCEDLRNSPLDRGPADGSPWMEPAVEVPPAATSWRLVRGGSWTDSLTTCRSDFRFYEHFGARLPDLGFRVVCLPQD